MTVTLSAGTSRLVVAADRGGRWASLQAHGLELLARADIPGAYAPTLDGCFAMAPYAGRVRDATLSWRDTAIDVPVTAPPHGIHGTVLDVPWQVVEASSDDVRLTTSLGDAWPFRGQVVQHLRLREDGLDALLSLHADEEMPVTLGLHPWFHRRLATGGDAFLTLPAVQQYERGADGLPTGQVHAPRPGPWDDCFVVAGTPELHWPGALRLRLESSHRHWVVFDELPDAVCVEPQTGPPDAVHLDAADVVPAGGRLDLRCSLSWTSG